MVNADPSTFLSVATYTCNAGYELDSGTADFNRTCQADGEWSLGAPNCNGGALLHYLFEIATLIATFSKKNMAQNINSERMPLAVIYILLRMHNCRKG